MATFFNFDGAPAVYESGRFGRAMLPYDVVNYLQFLVIHKVCFLGNFIRLDIVGHVNSFISSWCDIMKNQNQCMWEGMLLSNANEANDVGEESHPDNQGDSK
ncbi:uncharacterized protein [Lolium perenne]